MQKGAKTFTFDGGNKCGKRPKVWTRVENGIKCDSVLTALQHCPCCEVVCRSSREGEEDGGDYMISLILLIVPVSSFLCNALESLGHFWESEFEIRRPP